MSPLSLDPGARCQWVSPRAARVRDASARLAALALLHAVLTSPLAAEVLHSADFENGSPWPALVGFSRGGAAVVVRTGIDAAGTIDPPRTVPGGAAFLEVDAAGVGSTAWAGGLTTGRIPIANTETDLARLTLSFDLWTSAVRPVRVRLLAFSSAAASGVPTGTLETVVMPPVAGSWFRHSLDLSGFSAVAGPGGFDPRAPFLEIQFELNHADGADPWPASAGHRVRIDNLSYTAPSFYVSSRTGNNANDGRAEARPLATIQRAVDLAQPGDVILVSDGTYTANVTWPVALLKAGTAARWIVLRAHPGGARPQIVSAPNTWAAIKMDHTSAYLEIRGFVVRGLRPQITLSAAEANYNASVLPVFNGNGIDADGRQGSGIRRPHHLRIIDNEVFDHCGGGISVISGDYLTIEGNTVYNNCWYMRYGGSGISFLTPTDVDGSSGPADLRTKLFILGNTVYRNQCFVRWKELDRFSDGNGIIVDTTRGANYAGRTLVQNNVAFGNGGSGIHAFDTDHTDIINNTAYYNGQSPALRWGEIFANRCADVSIANNILWASQGRPINSVGNSNPSTNRDVTYTNNLYYGDGGNFLIAGAGDLRAPPQFALLPTLSAQSPTPADNVLVGPFDFRLLATSPGIDSGSASVHGLPRRDLAGAFRPLNGAPDRGAFESDGAPVLTLQPDDATVAPGAAFVLRSVAPEAGNRFQWWRDGVALAGETEAWLARAPAGPADAGSYAVRVTNVRNLSTLSRPARVALDADASRLVNVSCRTHLAAGATLIPGFVLGGAGSKTVLLRAIGPGLVPLGVTGVLPDPQLRVFRDGESIAANDNWDAAQIGDAFARVGAFGLPAGSRDAALVLTLEAQRNYTVHVTGGAGSGVVLLELYDADPASVRTARLTNVAVRGAAGAGESTLILGFVVGGRGARPLLLRAAGPALNAFGVAGALPDPRLSVFNPGGQLIGANDDWTAFPFPSELEDARRRVGAFELAAAGKDAGTLTRLGPGSYSVHVTDSAGRPGEALAEIYEAP